MCIIEPSPFLKSRVYGPIGSAESEQINLDALPFAPIDRIDSNDQHLPLDAFTRVRGPVPYAGRVDECFFIHVRLPGR